MPSFHARPQSIESLFPVAPVRLELITTGQLITQAKWEEHNKRVSSCYPAAVLNAAILSGALEPDIAHAVHERMLELPDNWARTVHPNPELGIILGWRWPPIPQTATDHGIADTMYQMYGLPEQRKTFYLRQLLLAELGHTTLNHKVIYTAYEYIKSVVLRTPLIAGKNQHATTVFSEGGKELYQVNPRDPHNPVSMPLDALVSEWEQAILDKDDAQTILEACVVIPRAL